MKKETRFLAVMSVLTTVGLFFSANLAYLSWWKPASKKNVTVVEETLTDTEPKHLTEAEKKFARYSYAS